MSEGSPPCGARAAAQRVVPREPAAAVPGAARISSEQLFAGAREVQIVHRGTVYRLRQTALHKLILTK